MDRVVAVINGARVSCRIWQIGSKVIQMSWTARFSSWEKPNSSDPLKRCGLLTLELGNDYPPRRRASVEAPVDWPVMRARWAAHQEVDNLHGRCYPQELWVDTMPLWEG